MEGGVAQATQAQAPITQVNAAGSTPEIAPPYTSGSEMLYIRVTVTVLEAKLVIMNVALLLIGMVMDTGPALLILAPMLIPLATELNIDVIHLGIIMVVNMAVGFVTPPFGVTLFVASPLCDTPPMRLGRKAVPFIITFLIALMFITFIPQISLCLL